MKRILRSVLLRCDRQRAFEVFTGRASEWWPASRRHTPDSRSEIVLHPQGRFYERTRDGHEVELGRVREWKPPARLVLDFFVGTDAAHPTEVVVTFAEAEGGTRVEIDHRPTALSAELWDKRAPRFDESWKALLDALADAVTKMLPIEA